MSIVFFTSDVELDRYSPWMRFYIQRLARNEIKDMRNDIESSAVSRAQDKFPLWASQYFRNDSEVKEIKNECIASIRTEAQRNITNILSTQSFQHYNAEYRSLIENRLEDQLKTKMKELNTVIEKHENEIRNSESRVYTVGILSGFLGAFIGAYVFDLKTI